MRGPFSKKRYIELPASAYAQYAHQQQHEAVPEEVLPAQPAIPTGMWEKCASCGAICYNEDLIATNRVCPRCGYHFRLSARQRIDSTVDEGTFTQRNTEYTPSNPLDFPGYPEKLENMRELTGMNDAVLTGTAELDGIKCAIAAMDGNFMMGSMGAVLGEYVTELVEFAAKERLPLLIFTVSGGARMQEGIISLMQMAKVSAALARHSEAGLLYITVVTDPTTGGVTASFASLGDIILAEPGATIGFAGKRVIEQTIRQKLPEGFQTSEFMLQNGFIDAIVHRKDMKDTLAQILRLHEEKQTCQT